MSEAVLSLQGIFRTFTQGEGRLPVLQGLHLEIQPGELVALVGPSGSGKSTLLQIAGLLDTPDAGGVMIAGKNMSTANDATRTEARCRHLGFVYQFHHLLPEFTAEENVIIPQMIAGRPENKAAMKARDLLGSLGLGDRLRHRPARLSGGEQQRVAIARALANDPVLLLADEPTGNLDPHTASEVFAMFTKLAKEKKLAALVATHNPELARRLDRTVELREGMLA